MSDTFDAAQAAQVLIDSHGPEAIAVARWRANYFKESGDLQAHQVWLSIIGVLESLAA